MYGKTYVVAWESKFECNLETGKKCNTSIAILVLHFFAILVFQESFFFFFLLRWDFEISERSRLLLGMEVLSG